MNRHVAPVTLAALLYATLAQADVHCVVPMTDWQPREAVVQLAADKGWTLRRIKIDDGCYEITGNDAEGHKFKLKLHPGTLAVMQQGHDDDSHPKQPDNN